MTEEDQRIVVPGVRICAAEDDYISGFGTYSLHGYIYSSLVGILRLVPKAKGGKDENNFVVSVEVHSPKEEPTVPAIGDVVTAKISSINPRFAKLTIECVRDITFKEPFRGMIRKEDIREYEKDKIETYKSFRPGDIILAKVISLGEASSGFLLSTAEDELGVAIAKSESSGMKMIPISWQEMQCPKTYNKEFRKVAQIIPDESARAMDSASVNAE